MTGVADAMHERIRSLIYLDGFVLGDGEAIWNHTEPKRPYFIDGAGKHAGRTQPIPSEEFGVNPADLAWVKSKVGPMALACFVERLRLHGNVDKIKKRTYVYAEGWGPSPFKPFSERLRQDSGWNVLSVETGHHMMIDDPEGCAHLLVAAA